LVGTPATNLAWRNTISHGGALRGLERRPGVMMCSRLVPAGRDDTAGAVPRSIEGLVQSATFQGPFRVKPASIPAGHTSAHRRRGTSRVDGCEKPCGPAGWWDAAADILTCRPRLTAEPHQTQSGCREPASVARPRAGLRKDFPWWDLGAEMWAGLQQGADLRRSSNWTAGWFWTLEQRRQTRAPRFVDHENCIGPSDFFPAEGTRTPGGQGYFANMSLVWERRGKRGAPVRSALRSVQRPLTRRGSPHAFTHPLLFD